MVTNFVEFIEKNFGVAWWVQRNDIFVEFKIVIVFFRGIF